MCAWVGRWLAARCDRTERRQDLAGRLVARHLGRCPDCRDLEARLAAVERGLVGLAATPVPPPLGLRSRLLTAFDRSFGVRPPEPARPGRLARFAWVTGGLAVVGLLGSVLWSRLDDFRPAPRTVRIELPPGYRLRGELVVAIDRASGEEERR